MSKKTSNLTSHFRKCEGRLQQDNTPCHKAAIISNWFLAHDSEGHGLRCPTQLKPFNPATLWNLCRVELRFNQVQLTCTVLDKEIGQCFVFFVMCCLTL